MSGFAFRKNTIFNWNNGSFRIQRLYANEEVLLESLHGGNELIVKRADILADYLLGKVSTNSGTDSKIALAEVIYSRPLDELSPKTTVQIQRRRHYLDFIFAEGPILFTKSYLQPIILRAAAKLNDIAPPGVTTVYRWYRKFRTTKDSRSLIPRFDKRGVGPKKASLSFIGMATEAIEEAFAASPQATTHSIYIRLTNKIDRENVTRLPGDRIKLPSLSTVHRLVQSASKYELAVLKEGKRIADKRFRLATLGTHTTGILERVEMDHTPLDLFLVDDQTGLPAGRPTLTVAIDHYSRMILGYHLSFDNPSTAAVMGALRHAILPKRRPDEFLGLKIENDWPCYGRPDVLVVDNGLEFHSQDLEGVAYDLGIQVQYCPKHSPEYKGVVERFLGTVNRSFARQISGTSFARFHQRGDYDSPTHAVLTLREFSYLFEKWVVDVYAQQSHKGIGTTPWLKWIEGKQAREPELPEDLHALKRRIGKVSERRLRKGGIELHGIRYNDEVLAAILRKFGEGVLVRVLFDPEDLGDIQVWGPNDSHPSVVKALNYDHAKGLTSRQNKMIRQILRENGVQREDRAALNKARNELIRVTDQLMTSRKQTARRRGAAIKGISSTKSETALIAPKKENLAVRQFKKAEAHDSYELPVELPVFQMKPVKREDE